MPVTPYAIYAGHAAVGGRGSVVTCATCQRQITGAIAGCAQFAVDAVFLRSSAKPVPHTCASRSRSKSGYPVGPRRLVCVISHVRQNLWLPGCTLPKDLRWLMNEQGFCDQGEQRLRWIGLPDYEPRSTFTFTYLTVSVVTAED